MMDRTATGIVVQRSKKWSYFKQVPVCSARENLRDYAVRCGYIGAYRVYNSVLGFDFESWKRRSSEQPASNPARNTKFVQRLTEQSQLFRLFLTQLCTDAEGYQLDLLPGFSALDSAYRKDEFEPEFLMRTAWRHMMNGKDSSLCELLPGTIDPGSYLIVAEVLRGDTETGTALGLLNEHYSFMQATLGVSHDIAVRGRILESAHNSAVQAVHSKTSLTICITATVSAHPKRDRAGRLALAGVTQQQFEESSQFVDRMVRCDSQLPADDMQVALRLFHNELSQLCEHVGVPFSYVSRPEMKYLINMQSLDRRKSTTVQEMQASAYDMAIIHYRRLRAQYYLELSQGIGVSEKQEAGGVRAIKLQYGDVTSSRSSDQPRSGVKRKFESSISQS
jgi:hypothetical protein